MSPLRYTFRELLNFFFSFQDRYKTIKDLAPVIGKSERAIRGWLNGETVPRDPEVIINIANAFSLNAQQTDLLLFAANEKWITYGTPVEVLQGINPFSYRDIYFETHRFSKPPAIDTLESSWKLIFSDDFTSNYRRWGIGFKDDGVCRIRRSMKDGAYHLRLTNYFHDTVILGGDSSCFAPRCYLFSVEAQVTHWKDRHDGLAVLFEELSDSRFALMRVREQTRQVSVVKVNDYGVTGDGFDGQEIYFQKREAPTLRPGQMNRYCIVATEEHHYFYVNNYCIGEAIIPRHSLARLDVGIVATAWSRVTCRFQRFRVYAPMTVEQELLAINEFAMEDDGTLAAPDEASCPA